MAEDSKLISIDQVKVGMFIKLDLSWFEHSFATSSFKITNPKQIQELYALQLKHVRYVPSKSDPVLMQGAQPAAPVAPLQPSDPNAKVYSSMQEVKRARLEKLKQQREELARCEAKFIKAAEVVGNIDKNIFHSPAQTLQEANKLVDGIAEAFLGDSDTVMRLIQQTSASEERYFHSLNVSVLAMMIAHEMKLSESEVKLIGLAGLFHDLGKLEIPDRITRATEKLSKPEQHLLEMHSQYGAEIGRKAGLPPAVIEVIANHHEMLDGSGYPQGLRGDTISMPTRILAIANIYDNFCNHNDPALSLTPHEALSKMYAHMREQFDPLVLASMIKSLGVYPPGTLVRLSNEAVGLVVNVNVGKPLRPCVLVYDEDIPKEDAMIIDLSEEGGDINISSSIRAGTLPKAVLEYLNPRKRINYYADAVPKAPNAAAARGAGAK